MQWFEMVPICCTVEMFDLAPQLGVRVLVIEISDKVGKVLD